MGLLKAHGASDKSGATKSETSRVSSTRGDIIGTGMRVNLIFTKFTLIAQDVKWDKALKKRR